jgi:DNA-binding CsgD family transcriptional regulator
MIEIDDFFQPSNAVHDIKEEDYQKLDLLTKGTKALARLSYKSLYIIDYFKKGFYYVSDNPLFLCGYTSEEVKAMGYAFYMDNVPPEELPLLVEINRAGFKFFNERPPEERLQYAISYDFHLKKGKKEWLVNHKLTPILLNSNGECWLALCMVSLSTYHTAGHVIIQREGESDYWELERHKWMPRKGIVLNEREKGILSLSTEGYTMDEIAEVLCLGLNTIKNHKRALFNKLHVKNIGEAISYVTSYKLL